MDAKEYDPKPAQQRWRLLGILFVIVVVPLIVWYFFLYYWPEERVVNKFFEAIEQKDMTTAYGIYFGDSDWQQHPNKYDKYPLAQFTLDWGPSSEYGVITKHHIECATEPDKKDFQSASGVIVVVKINGRAENKSLWVEKKSKIITDSPFQAVC
jgi:hypothetical protein